MIRTVAAAIVAARHVAFYLHLDQRPITGPLRFLPGLPVFFLATGMLTSRAWSGDPHVVRYLVRRAARIYVPLIVGFGLSMLIVLVAGYRIDASAVELLRWVAAQVSVAQFYNPGFMRAFGNGVLNGALWSISVTIQFTIIVPFVRMVLDRLGSRPRVVVLGVGIVVAAMANAVYWQHGGQWSESPKMKVIGVTLVPWLFMFLVGLAVERWFDQIQPVLEAHWIWLTVGGLALIFVAHRLFGWQASNAIHPVNFLLYAVVVLALAFGAPPIKAALQRRYDISYGLFLFHMPVLNVLLFRGWVSRSALIVGAVYVTLLALFSKFVVEVRSAAVERWVLSRYRV